MDMNHFKLQFITHFTDTYSYLDSARMALEGDAAGYSCA